MCAKPGTQVFVNGGQQNPDAETYQSKHFHSRPTFPLLKRQPKRDRHFRHPF